MDSLFKEQVLEIVALIPKGRATTYGAIAKAVGYPNHARHVGNVLKNCNENTPAHRVCNACGKIPKNYLEIFTEKLKTENVIVKTGKIENWKSVFWNPLEEL